MKDERKKNRAKRKKRKKRKQPKKPVIKKQKPKIKMEKTILKGSIKSLGRIGFKVMVGYIALGPLFEVTEAQAQINEAKAEVKWMKQMQDEAYAKYFAEYGKLTDTKETPAVTSHRHLIRVYDISKFRLTAKEKKVSKEVLGVSYQKISFLSLTDLDKSIVPALSQFDCQGVSRTGRGGIRRVYTFKKGYAERGNYRMLKEIFQLQMRTIRFYCSLKRSEGTLEPEEEPLRPDSDSEYDWLKQDIEEITDDWVRLIKLIEKLHNAKGTEEYEGINDEFIMSFDFLKEKLKEGLDILTFIINTENINPDLLEELKEEKEYLDSLNYYIHNEI